MAIKKKIAGKATPNKSLKKTHEKTTAMAVKKNSGKNLKKKIALQSKKIVLKSRFSALGKNLNPRDC